MKIQERLKSKAQETKEAKQNKILEERMANMLKDIILHSIFLLFVIFICYSNQDPNFYYQNKSIYDSLPNPKTIKTHEAFWEWLEKGAVPNLYPKQYYNKANRTKYDLKHTQELNHMRFSAVRLSQYRIVNQTCKSDKRLISIFSYRDCVKNYEDDIKEDRNYSLGWKEYDGSNYHPAYSFSSKDKSYALSLGIDSDKAMKFVKELKKNKWTDRLTRKIVLDVTIMNQETVSQAIWQFEMKITGGLWGKVRCDSLKLYRYTGGAGLAVLIFEIASILFFLILTIRAVYRFLKYGPIPGILLILSLVCFLVAAALFIWRTIIGIKAVETVMNSRHEFTDLSTFFNAHDYFMIFIGFSAFFGELHVLTLLKVSRTISVLVSTLYKSRAELSAIGFCCVILFLAYAISGYIILGPVNDKYSTFPTTCYSLIETVFGHLSFDKLSDSSGLIGKLFIISYGCLMLYLVLNVFITTLNEFLAAVKADPKVLPDDHQVFEYMTSLFKQSFNKKSDSKTELCKATQFKNIKGNISIK